MHRFKILMIVSSVMLVACVKNPFRQPSDYLDFRQIEFNRSVGECQEETRPCAKIHFVFPEAYQGDLDLVNAINTTIYSALIEELIPDSVAYNEPPDLGQLADGFLQGYLDFLEEYPDSSHRWEVSIDGEIIFQSSRIFSIQINRFSYTGGAHPNSSVSLYSFDANTGELLDYENVIPDMDAFSSLVETEFRKVRGLTEQADLNEAGFFWDGNFFLPANFAVIKGGVRLYYNPYEAAAYSMGPTELSIPVKGVKIR